MAPKKRPASQVAGEVTKKRKMMSISEKIKLLDLLKQGQSYAAVARQYGVNESTVRYIKKEEANIRKTYNLSFNLSMLCSMGRALGQKAKEIDEDMVRAVEFANRLEDVMLPYKNILQQKKRQRQQLSITMFFPKKKNTAATV